MAQVADRRLVEQELEAELRMHYLGSAQGAPMRPNRGIPRRLGSNS
jgi:hypothetical protein